MSTTVARREPRTLRTWDPFNSMREEVEGMLSNLVGDRANTWLAPLVVPPMDVSETASAVSVKMDLPGIKPEEIDIQLSGNVLTICGQREETKQEKGETFHRVERRAGSFSRSITLPCAVTEVKVDAKYNDGVLTVTMPKTDEAKSRKIKVKG